MKKHLNIGIIGLAIGSLLVSCSNPAPNNEAEASKTNLIFENGSDDWFQKDEGNWSYDGDELVATVADQEGFVMTKDRYKNFILELEFHPDSSINSGVFIRCGGHAINGETCYEINIWDNRPEQDYRTASIVGVAEPLAHIETIDRWNSYTIKCEDDHLQVWLNDTLTVDHHDKSLIEGHIGLQAHGTGEIRFRNVKIASLD